MKSFYKTVFVVYLLVLLWLVLFKLSADLPSVLLHYQTRGLNLLPFADMQGHLREIIDNVIVFIPFGLLASVNFKQVTMWRKLACIFTFSVAVETIQFVSAIGVADITDVIANTLGGLFGLMLYDFSNKYVDTEKQDRFIVIASTTLIVLLILLRFFVFRVRY